MTAGVDIINIAQKQVNFYGGTTDKNPYGDWYGIPNEPWCAMFVSWVFAQNNLSNLVAAQTPKGFSYCPAGLTWFQQKGQVVPKYSGQAGDLVFFSWAGNGQADHVGIVVAASRDGITTIEGNTGPEHMTDVSQYDGHGVYMRHRAYLYVLAIVRPNYETVVKPAQSLGTNKLVAGGVAGATALGAGGVAATHQTTPTTTKVTTTFSAPAWKASDFMPKAKSASTLAVEKALFKAGLLPAVAENSAWTTGDQSALKAFQKAHNLVQGAMNQTTYDLLMKELP